MSEPLLETRHLMKQFGGVRATNDVNLQIRSGEIHAIIGPNGAGKTTLIAQLCGMQRPDSGQILFDGQTITHLPPYKRARLGMTRSFQITSLIMEMTVLEHIALAVQARAGSSFRFFKPASKDHHYRDEAMAVLKQVGLADYKDSLIHTLSHGAHRHIEIALALAANAKLMLLDEPMAGLGIEEGKAMVALLQSLKQKQTILLIEHDMEAVFELADHISVLVYGEIIATGTPDEIRNNQAVREAYLGDHDA